MPTDQTTERRPSHTPGPWSNERIWDTPETRIHARRDGGVPVALAEVFTMWNPGEKEANARLIAAAPDLLDALRELLAAWMTSMPPYEAGKEAQDAWADRRAAARNNAAFLIAKVTGNQPHCQEEQDAINEHIANTTGARP